MQIAIPTHKAAMLHIVHVRRSGETGARSGFESRLAAELGAAVSPERSMKVSTSGGRR